MDTSIIERLARIETLLTTILSSLDKSEARHDLLEIRVNKIETKLTWYTAIGVSLYGMAIFWGDKIKLLFMH